MLTSMVSVHHPRSSKCSPVSCEEQQRRHLNCGFVCGHKKGCPLRV
jgi:hypothetical protein